MTIRDTPPLGVTVLSFELNVTGAVLQPGNVSVLSSPQQIELTKLETEAAFLTTFNAPPGTYSSLVLTFANPELTILNNSGASLTAFGQTCANGQVCEFKPSISPVTVSFSGSPLPLTLSANAPVGLQVDVSLNTAIGMDLSINLSAPGAVSVSELPVVHESEEQEELDDVKGKVTSLGTNQFTLQTADGRTLTISVDSNTRFDFEGSGCAANNFSCLAVGQIIEVDLSLLGNGTFLAKKIDFEGDVNTEEIDGTVVSLGGGPPPTTFQIVVQEEVPNVANIAVGNPAMVTIQSGATFRIDQKGFTLPGGLSFASASDLLVGQEVQVRVVGTVNAGPPVSLTTNLVELRSSQITAQVSAINTANASFTINNLPSLFPSGSSIQVLTSSQTVFKDLSPNNLTGLATGRQVSVKGLLFNTVSSTGSPTLVAEKVRGRSGP